MNIDSRFSDGVLRLAIRVADARNALDFPTVAELRAALADARGREDVRLVILESGLDRVFSLGMNLTRLEAEAGTGVWAGFAHVADYAELLIDIATMPMPTVAVIDGVAAGGGVEMACVCDVSIGTTRASFSVAQLRKGIFPFITSAVVVPKIGQSRFLHWALSGQTFPARRLFDLGLINQICEPDELARTVAIFAERVLTFEGQTLRAGMSFLRTEAEAEVRTRIRHACAMFALNCLARRESPPT